MKKKFYRLVALFILTLVPLLNASAWAQNKVVVIPLMEEAPMADFYPSLDSCSNILDNSALRSYINVPISKGVTKNLQVVLFIEHTHNADLDVTLTHVPTSKGVNLFIDVGVDSDGMYIHLDDDAPTSIESAPYNGNNPITGRFNIQGNDRLAFFNGTDASGEWGLRVFDDNIFDTGTLITWGLYIVD